MFGLKRAYIVTFFLLALARLGYAENLKYTLKCELIGLKAFYCDIQRGDCFLKEWNPSLTFRKGSGQESIYVSDEELFTTKFFEGSPAAVRFLLFEIALDNLDGAFHNLEEILRSGGKVSSWEEFFPYHALSEKPFKISVTDEAYDELYESFNTILPKIREDYEYEYSQPAEGEAKKVVKVKVGKAKQEYDMTFDYFFIQCPHEETDKKGVEKIDHLEVRVEFDTKGKELSPFYVMTTYPNVKFTADSVRITLIVDHD